jgi:hypothetical protein
MCTTFENPAHCTSYCYDRSQDLRKLREDLKAAHKGHTETDTLKHCVTDLGYCRVHVQVDRNGNHQEVWICDKLGQTKVSGRNISVSQVLAYILRVYW